MRSLLGKLSRKLTYANVVATLALFIALGGVSYAAVKLPKNSVGSAQIKKGAVTLPKISKSAQKSLKGAQGSPGSPGTPGKDGAPGATGPSDAYVASGYVASLQSGQDAELGETADLPAGKYVLFATAKLLNTNGALQNIHCNAIEGTSSGGGSIDQASSMVYGAVGADASIAIAAPFEEFDDTHHVSMSCHNDGTSGGGVTIETRINVIKVGEIHTLTG